MNNEIFIYYKGNEISRDEIQLLMKIELSKIKYWKKVTFSDKSTAVKIYIYHQTDSHVRKSEKFMKNRMIFSSSR